MTIYEIEEKYFIVAFRCARKGEICMTHNTFERNCESNYGTRIARKDEKILASHILVEKC
jgi:hypothetical protein